MRRASRLLGRLFFYLLVVFVVVYSVFPFYWAVISSFKPSDALFSPDPSFLPVPFTLEHYKNVFLQANFGRNLLNSLIVAGGATLLSLVLGVLAAYALGRLPFPPKNAVMYIVLSMTMFPQIAVLGGLFLLLRQTGLFNTHLGLILTYLLFTLPFTVWVLVGYFRGLPRELEEAARQALGFLMAQEDVAEAGVFVSCNGVLHCRLNYTSHIPSNGVEEPKSLENFGIGLRVVLRQQGGEGRLVGFGSEPGDLSLQGVRLALEKARRGAVADPEFTTLPQPTEGQRRLWN